MAWDSGTYRRDASKANRGRPFEDFINFANEKYQAKGIAVMHKVPTEFIPLRGAHGQVANCKVERKSCVDYLGRFRDIPVAVEAKHTQGARIDFSAVQDHQAEYLDAWMEGEGRQLAFVAVSFGMNRFFMVPWSFWKVARDCWERHKKTKQKEIAIVQQYGWTWETPGTASAKAEDLLPDWEVDTGGFYGLQYLQIIDKIALIQAQKVTTYQPAVRRLQSQTAAEKRTRGTWFMRTGLKHMFMAGWMMAALIDRRQIWQKTKAAQV